MSSHSRERERGEREGKEGRDRQTDRQRSQVSSPLFEHQSHDGGSTPRPQPNLITSLNPPLNTITLGIKVSTYEFGVGEGHKRSVHNNFYHFTLIPGLCQRCCADFCPFLLSFLFYSNKISLISFPNPVLNFQCLLLNYLCTPISNSLMFY